MDAKPAVDVSPDVIVADYETGMRLATARRSYQGEPRLMILAAAEREYEVRRALEQGVHGYLPLGCGIDEFVRGVRLVARGSRYLGMSIAQCMASSLTREALTEREAEVLELLAGGACNKSIARQLDIAVGTAKAHVKSIMGKLEASSRTQAVTLAAQRGLLTMTAIAPNFEARGVPHQSARAVLAERQPAYA